jgi:hypothetical protein
LYVIGRELPGVSRKALPYVLAPVLDGIDRDQDLPQGGIDLVVGVALAESAQDAANGGAHHVRGGASASRVTSDLVVQPRMRSHAL